VTVLGPALLFCPGDRPDRYAKAAAGADAVVLDLEDSVSPDRKPVARAALVSTPLDPATTIVRVNGAATGLLADDLAAVRRAGYRLLMLAKAEAPEEVDLLEGHRVLALCESPRGVDHATALAAHPHVEALCWGAEDLVAGLGGTSSRGPDGAYRDVARYARSRVLLAAAAADKVAYDAVHLDLTDDAGLAVEAADAAGSGFAGTLCIHPRQVPVVRAAYRPTQQAVDDAAALLDAAERSGAVFAWRGRMVDEPLLRQARRILDRSREHQPGGQ
jgi:citrate lyase subunit beta / citryl-CoA lyase